MMLSFYDRFGDNSTISMFKMFNAFLSDFVTLSLQRVGLLNLTSPYLRFILDLRSQIAFFSTAPELERKMK